MKAPPRAIRVPSTTVRRRAIAVTVATAVTVAAIEAAGRLADTS